MLEINGLLGIPRKSVNNNFYFASELAKGHGEILPLRLNHGKLETDIVGKSELTYKDKTEQLTYKAIITNPDVEKEVRRMKKEGIPVKVSLGLTAGSTVDLCRPDGTECMNAALDVKFKEMSILLGYNPGIPETTVNITEMSCGTTMIELYSEINFIEDYIIDSLSNINTSISSDTTKSQVMTTETDKSAETLKLEAELKDALVKIDEANTAKSKVEAELKAKVDIETKAKEDLAKKELADKESELNDAKIKEMVEKKVAEATEKLEKQFAERQTEVSTSTGISTDITEAEIKRQVSLMERVLAGESVSIKLDKEEFINNHSIYQKSVFAEAVSTGGTIPGVDTGSQIVILPGGIKVKSIRPWIEVKTIKQGDDTARFYTLTIPAFGDITEHVSTEITPATHTLTGIDVTANTPRGFRQNVLKTEVEKYPVELLEKIRETARMRAVEDEVKNTLNIIAASVSVDFGANHFDASDGTLVVDNTDEDATGEFKAIGLEQAKQRLEEQGHDPENGQAVAAISPRAQKTLIQDTALVRFMQQADPSISRLGRISMYFGIEIFVTNSLKADLNNSTRNIVFMKGQAFGLATARDLEIEFDKNINRQSVDIVATHRVNSVIKDATAYCILSSKAD